MTGGRTETECARRAYDWGRVPCCWPGCRSGCSRRTAPRTDSSARVARGGIASSARIRRDLHRVDGVAVPGCRPDAGRWSALRARRRRPADAHRRRDRSHGRVPDRAAPWSRSATGARGPAERSLRATAYARGGSSPYCTRASCRSSRSTCSTARGLGSVSGSWMRAPLTRSASSSSLPALVFEIVWTDSTPAHRAGLPRS
jgi:hypothetical protein